MRKNYVSDIYVDSGSSTDVMYKHFFKQLLGYMQAKVEPLENHLISFVGHNVWPEGAITLPLTLIDYHNGRNNTKLIHFVIINASSQWTKMHKFKSIESTIHRVVKFQTMSGVGTI